VIAFLLAVAITRAQDFDLEGPAATPAEIERGIGAPPFGVPPATEEDAVTRTMALAHRLRCPVCQGLSVADSTSEAALGMKSRITELVHLGYTDDQITDYFVDRYGEWNLLAPKDPLLWVIPVAGVLTALGALTLWLSSRRAPASPPVQPQPTAPTDDPYRRRILRELGE
jgi:cytochrome c-type biogenesis protein CcmH